MFPIENNDRPLGSFFVVNSTHNEIFCFQFYNVLEIIMFLLMTFDFDQLNYIIRYERKRYFNYCSVLLDNAFLKCTWNLILVYLFVFSI